jgi:hypothetical protein
MTIGCGRVRRAFPLIALAAAGCGADQSVDQGQPCTAIGARSGVSIEVAAPVARKAAHQGTVTACWSGRCVARKATLSPSTVTRDEGCAGTGPEAPCSAREVPDGDARWGFADIAALPGKRVTVTLTLHAADGDALVEQTLTANPEVVTPNCPDCPGRGQEVHLRVDASGRVHTRSVRP